MKQPPKWFEYLALIGTAACILLLIMMLLSSCNSVQKSQRSIKTDSVHVTLTDTIRVKKVDTTHTTHEVKDYKTKTIEVYDTIRGYKDSIITVLKKRIVYADSFVNRTVVSNGLTSDSGRRMFSDSTSLEKTEKDKKKDSRRFPIWQVSLPVCALIGVLLWLWSTGRLKRKPTAPQGPYSAPNDKTV